MKDYFLKKYDADSKIKLKIGVLIKQFSEFLGGEKIKLIVALTVTLINSVANVAAPLVIGLAIDGFIKDRSWLNLVNFGLILGGLYIVAAITHYFQTISMGTVGQNVLFRLRNEVFKKIQSLPLAFFNQNKLGDLISRINSDTDKLNQFFSQSLNQFMGQAFVLFGIGTFIFFVNWKLALWTMMTAVVLLIITYLMTPYLSKKNRLSLQSLGGLSAEVQESLNYFKVIVLFDRRDFFRDNFKKVNEENFAMSVKSGVANNLSGPIYDLAGNLAMAIVLLSGVTMVSRGELTVGILIAFLGYTDKFYSPLRQMAQVWSNTQLAFAAWIRISEILNLKSDLVLLKEGKIKRTKEDLEIMRFEKVDFSYDNEKLVLSNVNFNLEKGKTYAVVGPTGGGKSTTAALMCRLYDPSKGTIYFDGKDIRSYENGE